MSNATEEMQKIMGLDRPDRKEAEQAYVESAFDLSANPIGSNEWCTFWKGWQLARSAPLEPARTSEWLSIPVPLNDDVRWILGRPNFWCAPIAEYLRGRGETIPRKAEEEQAAVIHWLLHKYVEHGDSWRQRSTDEVRAAYNEGSSR